MERREQQKQSREAAIRAWQAKQNYDIPELERVKREKDEERLRVIRRLYDCGFDIQGMSYETMEHIVNNKLI